MRTASPDWAAVVVVAMPCPTSSAIFLAVKVEEEREGKHGISNATHIALLVCGEKIPHPLNDRSLQHPSSSWRSHGVPLHEPAAVVPAHHEPFTGALLTPAPAHHALPGAADATALPHTAPECVRAAATAVHHAGALHRCRSGRYATTGWLTSNVRDHAHRK